MNRPFAKFEPSPNFKERLIPDNVRLVVLHSTATSGITSPLEWLCSPQSKSSSHYLIGKDGLIYQLVEESDIAYHAGVSRWRGWEEINPRTGNPSINHCSIGIELVNANDGKDPYPMAQMDAVLGLTVAICKDYGIRAADVIGHKDVAPGRKTDPAGFDFAAFRSRLFDEGV